MGPKTGDWIVIIALFEIRFYLLDKVRHYYEIIPFHVSNKIFENSLFNESKFQMSLVLLFSSSIHVEH